MRALSSRIANRSKFVALRGANKGAWRGVVDLIAIRKKTERPSDELLKRGDLFDIVLIQVKDGRSEVHAHDECRREAGYAGTTGSRVTVERSG